MNHLDEGTIHAWLDGALDATQAGEIETHVASCATCAAAVAEARGFIAGASRILGALDEVPSGVIPKRVPVAPAAPVVAPAKAKRMWRASRWVTGIAALFLGAVVLKTAQTNRGIPDDARSSITYTVDSPAAPAADVAVTQREAQPPTASPGASREVAPAAPSVPQQLAAKTQPTAGPRRTSAPVQGGITGGVGALKAAAGGGDGGRAANTAQTSDPTVARDIAATSPAPPPAVAAAETRARDEAARVRPEVAELRALAGLRADTLTELDRYAGCYRLADRSGFEAPQAVSSLSDATRRAAAARGAAAPTAAPSTAAQRMDYTRVQLPRFVRLDTTRGGGFAGGYVVRSTTSDSVIGSWLAVRDSARVHLLSVGTFVFTRDQKSNCP